MTDDRPYFMTISLDVLRHLGIGLYSNIPAVLSELVANAWDADASCVRIDFDHETPSIAIRDDGHGMNLADVNAKFLTIGYQRRRRHAETPGGRTVMGRKGIGKLAAFSIADTVDVHTSDGESTNAFRMNTRDIEEAAATGEDYFPTPIDCRVDGSDRGTLIHLTDLRKRPSWAANYLRRRLARRFSIIGGRHGFGVFIDGDPITLDDRDYFNDMEFIWHFGVPADDWDFSKAPSGESAGALPSAVFISPPNGGPPVEHAIRGFIGTVQKPSQLDDVNNAVVLSARGRLIHEDMLPEYRQARVYTEYVVGEVIADFLDDHNEDIITSGRQRVQQDDPRYKAVRGVVNTALHSIRDDWDRRRKRAGLKRALEYPSVKAWYGRMGPDTRRTAKRLFGKIEALRLDTAEPKYQLYRASILAFEKLALKDMLSALDDVQTRRDFDLLSRLMTGVDEIEATRYRDIVEGRLKVIQALRNLVPNALERALQEHLFNHLWLLHPSWERAATAPRMEETVGAEFAKIDAGLSEEERRGRIDIRFQTVPGKHVIVELKRYDARVNAADLVKQLQKYRRALEKCLRGKYRREPHDVECVAVLGAAPTPQDDPEGNRRILDAIGARYVTYDELVQQAEASYDDYLKARTHASDLDDLLTALAHDFGLDGKP
ncbi:MAG: hypothetical protein F4Y14_17465 [Acidobacteria bacterium]|nr:hypothetical protein [Acidobacteriota bacterium]